MGFYDGRPGWEEAFEPVKVGAGYEVITRDRAVFIVNGAVTHTPTEGAMFGVSLETDGASASAASLGVIGAALAGHNAPMNGSRLELGVRMMGTKRIECAAPVAKGQYCKPTANGRMVPGAPGDKSAVFLAKDDGAIGSLTLFLFNGLNPINL